MNEDEFLELHHKLWEDPAPETVSFRGEEYNVEDVLDADRKFRRVHIEDKQVITQNLRKPSSNTMWVRRNPGHKLTWIIKDNSYIGKASTEVVGTRIIDRVFSLNPERLLKTVESIFQR